jgi:hypothetical protein
MGFKIDGVETMLALWDEVGTFLTENTALEG